MENNEIGKLPKNWCIKVCIDSDNSDLIKYKPQAVYDWRVKKFGEKLLNGGRWSWNGYINNYGLHSTNLCSQEITLEQFEYYVLCKRNFRLWKLKTI